MIDSNQFEKGRIINVNGHHFHWCEDVRFMPVKYDCLHCKKKVHGYRIPFFTPAVSQTVFCSNCHSILEKPEVWGEHAPNDLEVEIKLSDGTILDEFYEHYLPRGYKLDDTKFHHCGGETMEVSNIRHLKNNVVEYTFECQHCLIERRIRAFKD